MDTEKQVERHYLDVVRRGIDDFPPGTVIPTERPDFLIESSGRTVGVEITRIFSPAEPNRPMPKSQDNERDLIAQRAQVIATAQSVAPVMVDIYFDSRQSMKKVNRDPIAERLVGLVSSNMPALGHDRSIENPHPMKHQFPPQIKALHIWRCRPIRSHLWQTGDAGIVNEDFATNLQQLINNKNGKAATYSGKCDACWLVVVADWSGPSAFFEISHKMGDHNYSTTFDRVYFVETHSDRVVLLNTSPSAG